MENFTFNVVDHVYRWESDFMVLEFSNPSIQGFSDFIQLTKEEEIMYYYYTVKVFKKVREWDEEENEVLTWHLVSERNTHDFPSIQQLKELIDFQLKDNPVEDGQKIQYVNGDVRYSKVVATQGFACDDFYEITKNVDEEGQDESYILYCGTTFDTQGDLTSAGIRTPYVSKEDLEELLKCVTAFISYSLDVHNDEVIVGGDSYQIKNNKIYEYGVEHGAVNPNKIEAIYTVGDMLDIKTVVNNQECSYDDKVVTSIEGNTIVLEDKHTIKSETIRYICHYPTDDMLRYKEQDNANEFLSILSDEEKEEFTKSQVSILLEKYKDAIIDRTWMCREEHGFIANNYVGSRVAEVTPVVEDVITKIKECLIRE